MAIPPVPEIPYVSAFIATVPGTKAKQPGHRSQIRLFAFFHPG
jgi:hypothetical protein